MNRSNAGMGHRARAIWRDWARTPRTLDARARRWLCAGWGACSALAFFVGAAPGAVRESGPRPAQCPAAAAVAVGRDGVVACEDSLAAVVGIDVLRDGGNAVDAAIAVALALAVTHPRAGNLGGGGFLLAYDTEQDSAWGLDFRETAPAATDSLFYVRQARAGQPRASLIGALAAGIPGSPAGLFMAWEWHGALPWSRLVEPARALADSGFNVPPSMANALAERARELPDIISMAPALYPDGSPPRAGVRLAFPELAATLGVLQDQGYEPFYYGEVARAMVDGVRAGGGVWTRQDLESYRPRFLDVMRRPLVLPGEHAPVHGALELLALPPPSSGGVLLGQALALLRAQPSAALAAGTPLREAALVEALRLAFADRNTHLADPQRMRVTVDALLDTTYLRGRARLLPAAGHSGRSDAVSAGDPAFGTAAHPPREGSQTTHLVVLDAEGNAASLTTTLNENFGSGFIVPGTGILLNDEMDDFDTQPGKPNLYGLVGAGRNAVAAGMRPLSSMSPTIVLRDRRVWFALGAAGGSRILTSVLQVLLYRAQDGMSLEDAVEAPRVHHQWLPDTVLEERFCKWPRLAAALRAMGYTVSDRDFIGRLQAAEQRPDGTFVGVADGRGTGMALAVNPAARR